MQNLANQPESVKQYFVHALKSLGLRHEQGVGNGNQVTFTEMKEAEILQFLENPQTTSLDLRKEIKRAIVQQYQNDVHGKNIVKSETSLSRQTVKRILGDLNVDETKSDALLRNLTAAGVDQYGNITGADCLMDDVVDAVITAMMKGINEQNQLDGQAEQAAKDLWTDTLYAEFEEACVNQQNQEVFNTWKRDQADQQLTAEYEMFLFSRKRKLVRGWVADACGNDAVEDVCDVKIKPNKQLWQQIRSNRNLLKASLAQCEKRLAFTSDQWSDEHLEDELTVEDILTVAGDEKSQILAFCQNRTDEQKQQAEQNPEQHESKKENQLENNFGKQGKKYIKEKTIPGSVVESKTVKGLKAGKNGPWRGLKSLYDRIDRMVSRVFKALQAIGFSQAYIERKTGYSFLPKNEKTNNEVVEGELEDPIKTDYEAVQEKIANLNDSNDARNFYAKTKARILRDNLTVLSIPQSRLQQDNEQGKFYSEYVKYLQGRIARGEEVLANKMPDKNSQQYTDPNYYQKLDKYVLDENNHQSSRIINNIKADRAKQANDYMADSIYVFTETCREGVAGEKENAKHEMAKKFFNLESSNISSKDLDEMTGRFYQKINVGKMYRDLTNLNGRDGNDMSIAALDKVNQFVVKDLQENAMKEQYNEYKTEKEAREDRQAVEQNRTENQRAAAEEMGMSL